MSPLESCGTSAIGGRRLLHQKYRRFYQENICTHQHLARTAAGLHAPVQCTFSCSLFRLLPAHGALICDHYSLQQLIRELQLLLPAPRGLTLEEQRILLAMTMVAQAHAVCIGAELQFPHQLVHAAQAQELAFLLALWNAAAHQTTLHRAFVEAQPQSPICTACTRPDLLLACDAVA
jgi:hypothetical protein